MNSVNSIQLIEVPCLVSHVHNNYNTDINLFRSFAVHVTCGETVRQSPWPIQDIAACCHAKMPAVKENIIYFIDMTINVNWSIVKNSFTKCFYVLRLRISDYCTCVTIPPYLLKFYYLHMFFQQKLITLVLMFMSMK